MIPINRCYKFVQESVSHETLNILFSLYKNGQDGDDSRGLITRTLNFHEFLHFCLKANPVNTYGRLYDWRKLDSKVKKQYEKIPHVHLNIIEPLLIHEEFHDKIYAFMINYGLSFEEILLYNTYLILRVKNPHGETGYNIEYYVRNQPTWLNPPTENPTSPDNIQLRQIIREQKDLQYILREQERLLKIYEEQAYNHEDIIKKIKAIQEEIKRITITIH